MFEYDPLAGNAVHVRRLQYLVAGNAHRIETLLVGHDEQQIGLPSPGSFFSFSAELRAAPTIGSGKVKANANKEGTILLYFMCLFFLLEHWCHGSQ